MEAWAIGAIVVMVITFVAVLALYAFLYVRFTRRVDGRVASPNVLHYWDFYRTLQRVSVPDAPQEMTSEQLLKILAHDVGSMYMGLEIDQDSIALARFDKLAQTYVAVDLDVLLSPDHRALFVRQSAFHPLVLIHHHGQPVASGHESGTHTWSVQGREASFDAVAAPPLPSILPGAPLITTETDVAIEVDQYRYEGTSEPLSPLVLSMLREALRQTQRALTTAADGSVSLLVEPGRRGPDGMPLVMVAYPGEVPRRVVQAGPVVVRYSTGDGRDWEQYQGPFRLAAGRWCVTAEVCDVGGRPLASGSRVYTVEAGFSAV